ncbi:OmpA family protein [Vibrio sp. CAU 1672]|uniref:MotY family protein n=1 Tax=Vibrio sp. CAU 1672 TaxID=3032594 RepID=UPI0023DA70ED|nr:OmpA family protein [Vibrio sp. CAU 1672]MDF2152622.1 OmpA family protein [Vibrio sp. CAU 1672]
MITDAKNVNLVAYLNKLSRSEECKKYSFLRNGIAFLIIIATSLMAMSLASAQENINIPMDLSSWSYKGDKFKCNLMHSEVPQGKFYFLAEPAGQITFIAEIKQSNNMWDEVVLLSRNAPWEKAEDSHSIASVHMPSPTSRFAIQRDVASLLSDIKQGRWVTLALSGSKDSADWAFTIPTIGIQTAMQSFESCRERLPAMTFAQARDIVMPFAFGQRTLSEANNRTLKALYSYLAADSKVSKVLIDGHSDSVGSSVANLSVSRQRAELVAKQLIKLGTTASKIEVRAHGSRYPVASNATSAGQQKNRRVTVRLVRDDEIVVPTVHATMDKEIQKQKVKVQ